MLLNAALFKVRVQQGDIPHTRLYNAAARHQESASTPAAFLELFMQNGFQGLVLWCLIHGLPRRAFFIVIPGQEKVDGAVVPGVHPPHKVHQALGAVRALVQSHWRGIGVVGSFIDGNDAHLSLWPPETQKCSASYQSWHVRCSRWWGRSGTPGPGKALRLRCH